MGNFKKSSYGIGNRGMVPNGLRRPCLRCDKMFYKDGKYQRLCRDCINAATTGDKNPLRVFWSDKKKRKA
jgi:hypothetical protein